MSVGWGRLGVCGSAVVPCCGVWVALEMACLATLPSLELEGSYLSTWSSSRFTDRCETRYSREGILYDEIDIMIIEK